MTQTLLGCWNGALSLIDGRGLVSSQEENSREGEVCRIWYDVARREVQEMAWWKCCKAIQQLALYAQKTEGFDTWRPGDPEPNYRYVYVIPANYLRAWYMYQGAPFTISLYSPKASGDSPSEAVLGLHTNQENAVLFYSVDQTNVNLWSPAQYIATMKHLAGYLAVPLRGNKELGQQLMGEARLAIAEATASDLNSEPTEYEHIPSHIQARWVGDAYTLGRFSYPLKTEFGTGAYDQRLKQLQNPPGVAFVDENRDGFI